MPFPRFITFKEGEHIYILLTQFPFYVGKLHRCETDYQMFQIKREVKTELPGYRIVLTFEGTLEGHLVYVGDKKEGLQKLMNDMISWYSIHRIEQDPKRYAKWKIP